MRTNRRARSQPTSRWSMSGHLRELQRASGRAVTRSRAVDASGAGSAGESARPQVAPPGK